MQQLRMITTAPEGVVFYEAFMTQFLARPGGFGLLATFIPEPRSHNDDIQKRERWRLKAWGTVHDYGVQQSFSVERQPLILFDEHRVVRAAGLSTVLSLFPFCAFEQTRNNTGWMLVDVSSAPPQPKILPIRTKPPLFEIERHRCRFCGKKLDQHAGTSKQCLLAPTNFEPVCLVWRTTRGVYLWDKNSMSLRRSELSTTTRTTTSTVMVTGRL